MHQNKTIHNALRINGYDLKCAPLYAYWEFVIELVGEQGVRKLTEIQLAQRPYRMDVLDIGVLGEVWNVFRVKLMPKEKQKMHVIFIYAHLIYISDILPSLTWVLDKQIAVFLR